MRSKEYSFSRVQAPPAPPAPPAPLVPPAPPAPPLPPALLDEAALADELDAACDELVVAPLPPHSSSDLQSLHAHVSR
jgi:hypothetical protein